MAIVRIPAISKEYLYLPGIQAFDATSGDAGDPTSLDVYVAFQAAGEPGTADWRAAEWVVGSYSSTAGTATARYLLDPAATDALTAGSYQIWLRVDGSSEQPERPVGTLVVT